MRKVILFLFILIVFIACQSSSPKPTKGIPPLSGESAPSATHQEMLLAINKTRTQGTICNDQTKSAVGSLKWHQKLSGAAKTKVRDVLTQSRSKEITLNENTPPPHRDSTGQFVEHRVAAQEYDYLYVGENLAYVSNGQAEVFATIEAWKASASHCDEMMKGRSKEVGVYFEAGVWATVFGEQQSR